MRRGWIDENRSCWLAELPPYHPGPALANDREADVAIVGGGLTGVSTAWHLAEQAPDCRIVLLEARSLANGASGRNGGQVLHGINGVEPRNAAMAHRIREATGLGIDIIERLCSSVALDTGFVRSGCLEIATSARSAENGQRHVEQNQAWGIPLRWLPGSAVAVHGTHGAVLDPGTGRVNSAALVRGLREPLRERGVEIYENSPVSRIEEGATIAITAAGHTIRARALVLATNAYTPALGYFRSGILPLHSHVIATAPIAAAAWQQLGWRDHDAFSDDRDRISYGCRTPGGRLLFGGGSNAAYTYRFGGTAALEHQPPAAEVALERRLRDYVPGLDDAVAGTSAIEHRWSGPVALTFDRVCSMGVGGVHANVYYALGYSGHGLALAALAGRVIADSYAGDRDQWRDLPFYQKRLLPMPPEPLRWTGYQIYTRLTGRSPRRR